jgi:hypothetical protein
MAEWAIQGFSRVIRLLYPMSNVKDRKTVRDEQFSDPDRGLKTRKLDRVAIGGLAPLNQGPAVSFSPKNGRGSDRKRPGATGSDREIFRNEKVFLTEKNPFSGLPLTVFLIILDN